MKPGKIISAIIALAVALSGISALAADKEIHVGLVEMADTLTVRVGQVRIITVLISPTNADDKTLEWSSSDEEVAAVIDDGVIAGISPGTAIITAESVNGRKAYCTVTVPSNRLDGIELNEDIIDNRDHDGDSRLLFSYELRAAVEKAVKKAPKGEIVTVTYNNKSNLSAAALRSAAYASQGVSPGVRLLLGTTSKGGTGGIQGQLRIDPLLAKNTLTDIKPGVYTTGNNVSGVKDTLSGTFGKRLGVILCEHAGSYGMTVGIAAKLDLSELDTKSLYFYRYDSETKLWNRLETTYSIDANGYLHFNSEYGGYIAVTDTLWPKTRGTGG